MFTSKHKEFLRVRGRIWYFRPGLLLANVRMEFATLVCVEAALMWTWLMTEFLDESCEEGHPCDVADQQQAVVFTSFVCVTDGVINLLKIKASQLTEVKREA